RRAGIARFEEHFQLLLLEEWFATRDDEAPRRVLRHPACERFDGFSVQFCLKVEARRVPGVGRIAIGAVEIAVAEPKKGGWRTRTYPLASEGDELFADQKLLARRGKLGEIRHGS